MLENDYFAIDKWGKGEYVNPEADNDNALREVREELGLALKMDDLKKIGVHPY